MIYHVLNPGALRLRETGLRSPRRNDLVVTGIILLLNTGGYLLPGVLPWQPGRFLLESAAVLPLIWRETYPISSALLTGSITLIVTSLVHPAQPFPYSVL